MAGGGGRGAGGGGGWWGNQVRIRFRVLHFPPCHIIFYLHILHKSKVTTKNKYNKIHKIHIHRLEEDIGKKKNYI